MNCCSWTSAVGPLGVLGCVLLAQCTPGSPREPVAVKAQPAMEVGNSPVTVRAWHTASLLVDGTVLIAGGSAANLGQATAEIYDPRTGRFAAATSMAFARSAHSATPLRDGRVLIFGGTTTAQAEFYDPRTGSFSLGPTASVVRSAHTATLLSDGTVLLAGGAAGTQVHASAEVFDPKAGTFSSVGTMSGPCYLHTASLRKDGKVLMVGGLSKAGDYSSACETELFDPVSKTFSVVTGPTVLGEHTASVLPSGNVLIYGGFGGFNATGDGWLYDAQAETFSSASASARMRHTAFVSPDGATRILGGLTGFGFEGGIYYNASVDRFTEVGGFKTDGTLAHERAAFTATVLPTGDALIVGGAPGSELHSLVQNGFGTTQHLATLRTDGSDPTLTALPGGKLLLQTKGHAGASDGVHIFNAATKTLVASGGMITARGSAAAVLLRSGKVLFAGGTDGTNLLASAELFDPAAAGGVGAFTATGALITKRRNATATLLPSGQVLIAGGSGGSGGLASTELYDPASGTFAAGPNLSQGRSGHTAVLMTTGNVLITSSGTAEVIDPIALTSTPTAAPGVSRQYHAATLLPSGEVLLVGGSYTAEFAELYDPKSGAFVVTDALPAATELQATLLPSGNVLISGGQPADAYDLNDDLHVYQRSAGSGAGRFVLSGKMVGDGRVGHRAATLPSGEVLLARGQLQSVVFCSAFVCEGSTCYPACDPLVLWKDGLPDARRPVLTTAPAVVTAGSSVDITGKGFLGDTDGSSGSTNASPGNVPILAWRPLSGQGLVYGTLSEWTDTTAKWTVPATALFGLGQLYLIVGGVPSVAIDVEIQPAPLGAQCSHDAECAGLQCVDGVCCDSPCAGPCEACSAALKGSGSDGQCGAVPPELDPNDSCVLGNGAPCTTAQACGSGQCVDGVCCDKPCDGQCEACSELASLGQCVKVTGQPRGDRAACDVGMAGQPCTHLACDGSDETKCAGMVGSEVSCAAPSCKSGVASLEATCAGDGSCSAPITTSCAPYGCAGDVCGAGLCSSNADCHPDYRCSKGVGAEKGECVLANATECDGDHTLISTDGTPQDCSPYRCTAAGACRSTCDSSLDCAQGYACAASGSCERDERFSMASGCGCHSVGSPSSRLGWLTILLALGLPRRRGRDGRRRDGRRRS